MVQINFGQREVSCKVVFYGPGMSGKTTNLEIIHKKAPKDAVGEMVSIATETDRTLYFDFLPLDLGQVAGMRTKFQLYTVPGQIYYNATRKLVLQGVDGVIFVADSSPEKMAENLESLQNLRDNLAEMSLTIDDVPLVIQYNKRDLPNAMSIADLNAQINPMGVPTHEGVAREGKGVFATLKEISRLVIEKLNKEHAPAANRRRTNTALGAPPSSTPPAQPTAMPPPAPAHTPVAQQRLPQRPPPAPAPQMAMPQARPPMPAQPTPARGMPQLPPQGHVQSQADPRDKHLAKAKPPSLDNLKQQPPVAAKVNLGATDPSLKRYQEASRPGGGGVKTLLIVLIGLIVLMIMAVVAVIYVPAVRSLLPQDLQRALIGPSATEPAKPVPAPTPTPASAAEQPAIPSAEKPAAPAPEKPAEPAAEKPAPPADKPAEPAPPAAEKPPAEKPAAEKPAETPAPAPTEKPADKPAEGANGQ